jgi:tRNA (adenine-N(1)-)-methyltransferase non-catalytic subunit
MTEQHPVPSTSTSKLPSPSSSSSLFVGESSSSIPISRDYIKEDDSILIKLPSGIIKPVKLKGNVSLGKLGSFKASELVGGIYGQTYELLEGGKIEAVKTTLNEIGESTLSKLD